MLLKMHSCMFVICKDPQVAKHSEGWERLPWIRIFSDLIGFLRYLAECFELPQISSLFRFSSGFLGNFKFQRISSDDLVLSRAYLDFCGFLRISSVSLGLPGISSKFVRLFRIPSNHFGFPSTPLEYSRLSRISSNFISLPRIFSDFFGFPWIYSVLQWCIWDMKC